MTSSRIPRSALAGVLVLICGLVIIVVGPKQANAVKAKAAADTPFLCSQFKTSKSELATNAKNKKQVESLLFNARYTPTYKTVKVAGGTPPPVRTIYVNSPKGKKPIAGAYTIVPASFGGCDSAQATTVMSSKVDVKNRRYVIKAKGDTNGSIPSLRIVLISR